MTFEEIPSGNGDRCNPTVVLADDHPVTLDSVGRVLQSSGIDVVDAVTDGGAAIVSIARHRPTVAVVDLQLPGLAGLEVVRRALRVTKVCVYTGASEAPVLLEVVAAGVQGIVLKDAPLADLVRAIRMIAEGRTYLDPLLAGAFCRREGPTLADRERNVLSLVAEGYGYEEIGVTLQIAAETVRAHVRNASMKLGTSSRTHAVAEALRRHLID